MTRPRVVIGLLGTTLDRGVKETRWGRWRPTVSLFQNDDFPFARLELVHDSKAADIAHQITADVQEVSPATQVLTHVLDWSDPWDFEEVFAALHGFARVYPFDPEREEYFVHIATGTHVAQICLFLL